MTIKFSFKRAISVLFATLMFCLGVLPTPAIADTVSGFEAKVLQVIKDYPEAILDAVDTYQQQQYEQAQAEKQALLQKISSHPSDFVARSPVSGELDNHTILIEFSDFQCPYCAKAHSKLSEFVDQHADQVTLVYKHYPLTMHSEAKSAAKAAWAAHQQQHFWAYHDALFEQQAQLDEAVLVAIAQDLNLDLIQFNSDRHSLEAEMAVANDIQLADQLGLDGTPYFVVGNQTVSGLLDEAQLEALLLGVLQA